MQGRFLVGNGGRELLVTPHIQRSYHVPSEDCLYVIMEFLRPLLAVPHII